MTTGEYGICELCKNPISPRRMEILPATRLCRRCAQKYEKAQKIRQHPRDEVVDDEMLDEYRDLEYEKGQKKISKPIHEERISNMEGNL
jgi:hypothetical protein